MAILSSFFVRSIIEAIGWTLIDFVWQGLIVLAFFAAIWNVLRRQSAPSRYLVLCAGMTVLALCPIVTISLRLRMIEISNLRQSFPGTSHSFVAARRSMEPLLTEQPVYGPMVSSIDESNDRGIDTCLVAPAPTTAPLGENNSSSTSKVSRLSRLQRGVAIFVPWAVCGWVIGVSFLTIRLLSSWRIVRKMRRIALRPVPDVLQGTLDNLARKMQVRNYVKLVQSALVEVPTVLGYFRPMILLPMSVLTGFEPDQLAALMAHELAHIRRHDYLVNLIQTVIETILFYHPAVWWVSHQIRQEREHCCDDLAVDICGDRMIYAKALTGMEERRSNPQFTLAANSGSLMNRIRRIVIVSAEPTSVDSRSIESSGIAILLIAAIGAIVLLGNVVFIPTAVAHQKEDDESAEVAGSEVRSTEKSALDFSTAIKIDDSNPAALQPYDFEMEDNLITESRTILELGPVKSKLIRFEANILSIDGFDTEIVEVTPVVTTHLLLRGLRRGVSKMIITDCDGRSFLLWILKLDGSPLSDNDRVKLLSESSITKIDQPKTTIEIFSPNYVTLEFPDRLRVVDGFDAEMIKVVPSTMNRLQVHALKSGVTEMMVQDETRQQFAVKVVVHNETPMSDEGRVKLASDLARSHRSAIRNAHLKLLRTIWIPKHKRTFEDCSAILQKHAMLKGLDESESLGEHRRFLLELLAEDSKPGENDPWSDCDLYMDGRKGEVYRWDGGTLNVLIDSNLKRSSQYKFLTLSDIFDMSILGNRKKTQIQQEHGLLKLVWKDEQDANSSEVDIDEQIGYSIRVLHRAEMNRFSTENHWLGWEQSHSGIPYPRRIVKFQFKEGVLAHAEVLFVQQATFNVPIDAKRPAGSGLVK